MVKTPQISLVKSPDSYSGVTDTLKLIEKEIKAKLKGKKRIVIKPNMVSIRHPLASTPVEAIKAVLDFLRPFYKGEVIIAEGSAENTEKGFKKLGYLELKKDYKIKFVDLNKDKAGKLIIATDAAGNPIKIAIAKTITSAGFIISITRPKTHDTGVVTLSLKNLLVGSIFEKWKVHQGMKFHSNLLAIAKEIRPNLAIIDGTVSMEGEGPAYGDPKKTNFAVAGLDALAVDSLVTNLMGFNICDVGYLTLMGREKLGQTDISKMKILGEKPEKFKFQFKPHPTFIRQINWERVEVRKVTLTSRVIGKTLGKAKKIVPPRLILEVQEIKVLRQFVVRIQNGF